MCLFFPRIPVSCLSSTYHLWLRFSRFFFSGKIRENRLQRLRMYEYNTTWAHHERLPKWATSVDDWLQRVPVSWLATNQKPHDVRDTQGNLVTWILQLPPRYSMGYSILVMYLFFKICHTYLPAPSKGCQINPKGWLIDTPLATIWHPKVQVQVYSCWYLYSLKISSWWKKNSSPCANSQRVFFGEAQLGDSLTCPGGSS